MAEKEDSAAAGAGSSNSAPKNASKSIWAQLYEIVTTLLPGSDPKDTSRTLMDAPPGGFGLSPGGYESFCDDCAVQANAKFSKSIVLEDEWRTQHESATADAFMADVYQLLTQ